MEKYVEDKGNWLKYLDKPWNVQGIEEVIIDVFNGSGIDSGAQRVLLLCALMDTWPTIDFLSPSPAHWVGSNLVGALVFYSFSRGMEFGCGHLGLFSELWPVDSSERDVF